MMDKVLRDASGTEIGRITRSGAEYILRDRNGAEVGRYNAKADVTKDRNGKIVGRGNLLTFLFGLD